MARQTGSGTPTTAREGESLLAVRAISHVLTTRLRIFFLRAPTGLNDLDDKRIKSIRPLIPPQILMEDFPLTMKGPS